MQCPANGATMPSMLSQDELRRRIRAARELAAVSQVEMNQAGAERGLPKNTLGKVERGDLQVRHVHLAMLCEILDVPMSWFTEPRKVIVAQRAADYAELVGQLFDLSQQQVEVVQTARQQQAQGRQRVPRARPAKKRTGS